MSDPAKRVRNWLILKSKIGLKAIVAILAELFEINLKEIEGLSKDKQTDPRELSGNDVAEMSDEELLYLLSLAEMLMQFMYVITEGGNEAVKKMLTDLEQAVMALRDLVPVEGEEE